MQHSLLPLKVTRGRQKGLSDIDARSKTLAKTLGNFKTDNINAAVSLLPLHRKQTMYLP